MPDETTYFDICELLWDYDQQHRDTLQNVAIAADALEQWHDVTAAAAKEAYARLKKSNPESSETESDFLSAMHFLEVNDLLLEMYDTYNICIEACDELLADYFL